MPLDPDLARYLESVRHQPPRSSLTIEQTSARLRAGNALAGSPPDGIRTDDLTLREDLRARMYTPAGAPVTAVVVYFHGGRFISGDLQSHDTVCRQLSIASGRRLLAVDYRLAPEHRWPAAAEDAVFATDWAIARYRKTAVAGDSAGANLAAIAASSCAPLSAQLLVYPFIDATCSLPSYKVFEQGYGPGAEDMRRGWELYVPDGVERQHPRVSPLYTEDLCRQVPALVITAEYDTLRDEGEAYANRLLQAGVACRLKRFAGAIHGFFGMAAVTPLAQEAMDECAAFLRERL